MRPPLWLDIDMPKGTNVAKASLSRCRNCGRVKVASDPCGFDHLAAITEFNSSQASPVAERRYIGRYSTREEAERVSARYGDNLYPNRTVEPEEVGRRVDWLIWTVPDA